MGSQLKRVSAVDRQRRALELRKGGATLEAIARELGYAGPSGACNAIETALRRTLREPAEELVALEVERLDAALCAIWPQVEAGNFGAVDRLLRIMERRARLLGLDEADYDALAVQRAVNEVIDAFLAVARTFLPGDRFMDFAVALRSYASKN